MVWTLKGRALVMKILQEEGTETHQGFPVQSDTPNLTNSELILPRWPGGQLDPVIGRKEIKLSRS